jgi:hemoglobin
MASSLFDQLGGEPALRPIVDRFVDRVFEDDMIGFLFRNTDRARIKQKEYEFAAQHLGASVEYTGNPLPKAHAKHRITGGQFMRRLQILREVLTELGAPSAVCEHWVRHTESLRPLITAEAGSECHGGPALRPKREQP